MTKTDLTIRVSKIYNLAHWALLIETTPPTKQYFVELLAFGNFPKVESKEFKGIDENLKHTFKEIFQTVHVNLKIKSSINYKCIFSDKYICKGKSVSSTSNTESPSKSIIFPMSEQECLLVHDSIPRTYYIP